MIVGHRWLSEEMGHWELLKVVESENHRMDPRTVSTLNYREDHLIIKRLWEFRQRVMRPELGRDSENEKTRDKMNLSDS